MLEQEGAFSLIIIATLLMLILAGGIIIFVVLYQRRIINHQIELKKIAEEQQLQLTQAAIESEEKERRRIASELHDDVGATLSSIRMFLHKADTNPEMMQESKSMLDESIKKVRNISHRLQPDILHTLGLQAALQSFAETITKGGSLAVTYTSNAAIPKLKENVELTVYRIVQELISNIIKHSKSTVVAINTDYTDNRLILTLEHDGTGLTNEKFNEQIYKKGAIGLKNIVNRLNSVNAKIDFALNDNKKYLVNITIPN
jgi:two-component system NarL family sensor kinase